MGGPRSEDDLRPLTDEERPRLHAILRRKFGKLEESFGHGDEAFQAASEKSDDLATWLGDEAVERHEWLDFIYFTDLVDESLDFLLKP